MFLCLFGLAGLFSAAGLGLLSQDAEPVPEEETPVREIVFDGAHEEASDDGEPEEDEASENRGAFDDNGSEDTGASDGGGASDHEDYGPGDGEPAVNFRFRMLGDHQDIALVSVFLNDYHLYTAAPADLLAPIDDAADGEEQEQGLELLISSEHVEVILGREIDDPDLPPVTVACVIHNHLTLGIPGDLVTWTGYLQGCWLEFPELAPLMADAGEEPPPPVLEPQVDVSGVVGRTTPLDVRLEKNTVYYLLFASEDREAILLHPEDPEIYARARFVAGGTYSFKEKLESLEEGISAKSKNLERLKYTPEAETTYLVLWTLHRAEEDEEALGATGEEPASTGVGENPRVNGWTRSAVYELTSGIPDEGTEPAGAE